MDSNLTPQEIEMLKRTFPEQETMESGATLDDMRMQRIADYEAAALLNADPCVANIGCINAGLMRTASCLGKAITQEFEAGLASPDDFQKFVRSIDTTLRLTRQIEHFTRFEREVR